MYTWDTHERIALRAQKVSALRHCGARKIEDSITCAEKDNFAKAKWSLPAGRKKVSSNAM